MLHDKFILLLASCLLLSSCGGQADPGRATASPTPQFPASIPIPEVAAMIKRIATQDGCRDFSAEIQMKSIDEHGKRDELEFKIQRKYAESRTSTFLTVLSPREEMDKALLAIEQPDRTTEAFFYLPGLKKLTRLNSGKQLGFREAKVTVQELLGMELGQYTVSPGERLDDGGQPRIRVELKEKPYLGLAFPRIIAFFREADRQPIRFELYDSRNELLKVVTVEEVRSIQKRQTLTRLAIKDLQQKIELDLETRKVEYDRKLPDHIFTEEHLKNFINLASHELDQSR
ncbi:MAG TPA: outer membrane lipoprotein-sorting protein [Blastocatellia bacterium]|nr:outer membrane lipoprotein-sorting protein [Blastocatellia bacterium]